MKKPEEIDIEEVLAEMLANVGDQVQIDPAFDVVVIRKENCYDIMYDGTLVASKNDMMNAVDYAYNEFIVNDDE
jgi:hypothetical protein